MFPKNDFSLFRLIFFNFIFIFLFKKMFVSFNLFYYFLKNAFILIV